MKLNKKGYMLVEIILASALAFGLAFFIIDLVIRLKNKNDDLFVETLITTDKTIITNKLMTYAKKETKNFDCNKLVVLKNNTVKYNDEIIDIITDYANVGEQSCSTSSGKISITIPLSVPQMPDKDYDITFDYKYEIGDMTPPTCSLSVSGTTIIGSYSDSGGSGVAYYGYSSSMSGTSSATKTINSIGTYTFYVKDGAGNSKSCSLSVINTTSSQTYSYSTPTINYTYTATGECACKNNNNSSLARGICVVSGTVAKCNCSSNTNVRVDDCDVLKKENGKTCPSGYYLNTTQTSCYKKTGVSYNCAAGYAKANNDYCYKINK